MANVGFLAGFLTLVLCTQVFAQSEPVVSPTPTPTPPETIKIFNLTLNDSVDTDKLCLRMSIAIEVNVTYIDENKNNRSVAIPLTNMATINKTNTVCHINSTTATLSLIQDVDELAPFQVVFEFSGSSKKTDQHWSWGSITFRVEDTTFLPDYNGELQSEPFDFNTTDRLDDDSNSRLEFERSYKCKASQSLNFDKAKDIHPIVYVSQLHVQAFHFKNQTGFDNARTCLLDTSGTANKIVPIAVGAALAGLVVVVLIAYLIGRLRSRRQSSYEALS